MTTDDTPKAEAALAAMPSYDISNEGWREYIYPRGVVLRIENGITLLVDKKPGGDRHRIVQRRVADNTEVGWYVAPGWIAIRWQTPDGKHGIAF